MSVPVTGHQSSSRIFAESESVEVYCIRASLSTGSTEAEHRSFDLSEISVLVQRPLLVTSFPLQSVVLRGLVEIEGGSVDSTT
jgi:hypothetical protein